MTSKMFGITVLVCFFVTKCTSELTEADEQKILDLHNEARDKINNCEITNQPPIRGQLKHLKYSEELATKARNWAQQGWMNHNPDRTSPTLGEVGENLAHAQTFERGVDAWFNESILYDYFNPEGCGSSCLHYTQMIWDETELVGCATAPSKDNVNNILIVCNYAPAGNMNNGLPYEARGKQTCGSSSGSDKDVEREDENEDEMINDGSDDDRNDDDSMIDPSDETEGGSNEDEMINDESDDDRNDDDSMIDPSDETEGGSQKQNVICYVEHTNSFPESQRVTQEALENLRNSREISFLCTEIRTETAFRHPQNSEEANELCYTKIDEVWMISYFIDKKTRLSVQDQLEKPTDCYNRNNGKWNLYPSVD